MSLHKGAIHLAIIKEMENPTEALVRQLHRIRLLHSSLIQFSELCHSIHMAFKCMKLFQPAASYV